jgi:hypothetical protein
VLAPDWHVEVRHRRHHQPKSSPLELQAAVPEIIVPFQPIIQADERPFAMLQDLWIKRRDWVFEPIEYSSVARLVETVDGRSSHQGRSASTS